MPASGPRIASSMPAETWPGMIGYGTPASRPCQRCTSVPHTSERSGPQQRTGRQEDRAAGTRGSRSAGAARASPPPGCGHPRRVRYSVDVRSRIPFLVALTLVCRVSAASCSAQTYEPPKPRRHFVSVSFDSLYTEPLHFAEHPLADLLGTRGREHAAQDYEYRTRDEATLIDVIEFSRAAARRGRDGVSVRHEHRRRR